MKPSPSRPLRCSCMPGSRAYRCAGSPAMRSMETRLDCGKRSRRMAASTCWRSQPTRGCGPSDRRWWSHQSRQVDAHSSGSEEHPQPAWSPRWSPACPLIAWKRLAVLEGEKGPIPYQWARMQVVESRDRLPGLTCWLLARRSLSDPKQAGLLPGLRPSQNFTGRRSCRVASSRYTVEQCIEEAKGRDGTR